MVKPLPFIFISLLLLVGSVLPAAAQNPFFSQDDSEKAGPVNNAPSRYPFLDKIALWQQRLNMRMAALTREAADTGNVRPILLLLLIAFSYGVLHAAGPGHGKAVAISYLISHKDRLKRGILLGNLVALFHGLSGVLLVLAVNFVLQKGVTGPLQEVTRTTQLISYSLIAILGAVLLARNVLLWRGGDHENASNNHEVRDRLRSSPLAIALAVGIVPCPGVVLVMLFCLSLNMLKLGLLLSLCLTLGMAVTISAVGIAGIAGKRILLRSLEKGRGQLAERIGRLIETAAALAITALGVLFFAATL